MPEPASVRPAPSPWRAEGLLAGLVPVVAVAAWIRVGLGHVDAIERGIRPLGGLAYAVFVQLAHNATSGAGWTQTVHFGYADDWRWGGHYTPLGVLAAHLASWGESPWNLARVQVVAVGLGGLAAWLLGRREGGAIGAAAGLLLYLGSGPVLLLALADYQDLVLVLPLLPLAVWAARHAGNGAFLLAAAALGATREEALVLLPLVGLAGGPGRALLGMVVAGAWISVYVAMGPPPQPNPILTILHAGGAAGPGAGALAPELYGAMAGAGWPWLLLAPIPALPAVVTAAFHAGDPTSVGSVGSPAIHHLAPLTAAGITAGIVGFGRVARLGGWPARVGTGLLLLTTAWSLTAWERPLRLYAFRGVGAGVHTAWSLLEGVDPEAVLYVPEELAPAAARRRWVVTPDSLGDRVPPGRVTLALDDGRLDGRVVAEHGGWRLVSDPRLPPPLRDPATGVPAVQGRQ